MPQLQFLNLAILRGSVGRIIIKQFKESKVANLSIVTNECFKDKDGCNLYHTTWFNVTVFEKAAPFDLNDIAKGSNVEVIGRFRARRYIDELGAERTTYDILANKLTLLGEEYRIEEPETSMPAADSLYPIYEHLEEEMRRSLMESLVSIAKRSPTDTLIFQEPAEALSDDIYYDIRYTGPEKYLPIAITAIENNGEQTIKISGWSMATGNVEEHHTKDLTIENLLALDSFLKEMLSNNRLELDDGRLVFKPGCPEKEDVSPSVI